MKLLFIISAILIFINFCYCKQIINYWQYADVSGLCYDEKPSGVGLSIATNKCFNGDINNFITGNTDYVYQSWYVYTHVDANNLTKVYVNEYYQKNCSGPLATTTFSGLNKVCYNGVPNMIPYMDTAYYLLITQDEPIYPDNTIIYEFYSNGEDSQSSNDGSGSEAGVCNSNEFLFSYTFSDNLKLKDSKTFNCKNGKPYMTTCVDNKCNTNNIATSCSSNKENAFTNLSIFCSK